MKKSSLSIRVVVVALLFGAVIFLGTGCGSHTIFANRSQSPSCKAFAVKNGTAEQQFCVRALIAIQNPGALTRGALQILDAREDTHYDNTGKIPVFSVGGFSGALPSYIQNFPEQQTGFVYGAGDGSFSQINYATESGAGSAGTTAGLSSSIAISSDFRYLYAANQSSAYVTVIDRTLGLNLRLNLPNVSGISVNPGGTNVLAFVQNSNNVYRVLRLQNNQLTGPPDATDCEPKNLPKYCLLPVPGNFDHPQKAVFTPDGATAYVLSCGPECGGQAASVSALSTAQLDILNYPTGPITSPVLSSTPIPGGATAAVSDGSTLYISGQSYNAQYAAFGGNVTALNQNTRTVTGPFPIGDGVHTRMLFGDDNSLWIAAHDCTEGLRTASGAASNGCMTYVNLSSGLSQSGIVVEPWAGNLTGFAPIIQWHKVYAAIGGAIQVYNTKDGSLRDSSNVQVAGTASDIAYMDAISNAAN